MGEKDFSGMSNKDILNAICKTSEKREVSKSKDESDFRPSPPEDAFQETSQEKNKVDIMPRKGKWKDYFPYEHRLNQDKLADFVQKNLDGGKICVVEAPYGIGKTITMLSSALATGKKVVVATCNHAAYNAVVDEVLKINRKLKKGLKVAALIGKKHFCPHLDNFNYEACTNAKLDDECPFYKDTYKFHKGDKSFSPEAKELIDKINNKVMNSPDDLIHKSFSTYVNEEARDKAVCPYEMMLGMAEEADVVVLDYYYVFSGIFFFAKQRIFKDTDDWVLLIDEADEVKERLLSGVLTKTVSSFGLDNFKTQVRKLVKTGAVDFEDYNAVVKFTHLFQDFFQGKDPGEYFDVGKDEFKNYIGDWNKIYDIVSRVSKEVEELIEERRAVKLDLFMEMWDEFGDDYFRYGVREGHSERLCLAPYELKETIVFEGDKKYLFRDILHEFHGVCFFSATIGNHEIFLDNLGLRRQAEFYSSQLFNTENLKVLIKRDISSIYSTRKEMVPLVKRDVQLCREFVPGVLMAFPSKAASYELIEELNSKDVTELDYLSSGIYHVILGGKSSRGINKASKLDLVYIYGLQLPQPDDYFFNKRKAYLTEKYGEEKAYELLYANVVNKACQTAGRIFRSKDKKGLVVFADTRYLYDWKLKNFFFNCMPGYFKNKVKQVRSYEEFEKELGDFWES